MNININRGTWSGDCTDENDLMLNQIKYPAIRKMLEYKDQRMVSTLLVNGAVGPYGVKDVPSSYLPSLEEGKMVAKPKSTVNAAGNYTKPELRKRIVSQVKAAAVQGTGAGQWSARKAQLVAKKYKAAGGGYKD